MQRAITGAALITTRRTHKNGTVDRSCAGNERFRLSDCSLRSRNTFLDRVNGCATVSLHGNVLIIFVETRLNQNMPPTFLLLPENPLALSFFLCPRMRTRQEILSHSLETIFPRVVLIYHRRFATSSWSSFKINKETRTIPVYRQTSPFTDYSHILRISHSRLLSRHRRMTSKSTCFLVKSKDRREIRLIYKYKNGIKFPRKSTLGHQCDISYAIIPRSKHSVG